MNITRIDALRCTVGESPIWDEHAQALFLLDIPACKVLAYEPASGKVKDWQVPATPTAMALGQPGEVLLAMGDTIQAFDLESGACTPVATAPDQPANAVLNDGRVDRQGRFVIGSCCTDFSAPSPVGGIYRLSHGRCERLAGDILFSNGTCFSPDGATLYFADSALHAVFAYDYDAAEGGIGERRLLAETHALGGSPDGANVSADGLVWVTINEGGKVAAFRPDGSLARTVDLPVRRPGSVAFGGPNLETLFVTTIDPAYFGEAAEDGGGYVFAVGGLETRGLPEPRYLA